MTRRYAIAIENAGSNYSAYVLDLPGCTTSGESVEEIKRNMVDAIRHHLEDKLPEDISDPTTMVEYVEVPFERNKQVVG